MSNKQQIETQEEKAPEVVLLVTVDETGRINVQGKETDPGTLKALGVELVCMGERARIKEAL